MRGSGTGETTAEPGAEVPPPRGMVVVVLMVVATFVVILNETLLAVALPELAVELGVDALTVQWLASAFLATLAVVIPTTGLLLQRLSTRRAFVLAMGVFTGGTVLAAVAPGFEVLLVARIVQAAGTAVMMPLTMTTVMAIVPFARLGAVMGLISMAIGVAPAIGPTVSGVVLHVAPWRFLFVLMIPFAVIALVAGLWRIENVGERTRTPVDAPSVLLAAVGFGGFVYGITELGRVDDAPGAPPVPPAAAAIVVAGLLLVGLFVWRQVVLRRAGRALLDPDVFADADFRLALVMLCVAMAALFGAIIPLPMYLTGTVGMSPLQVGMAMLPGGLLMGLIGRPVGVWADKVGPRRLLGPGMVLVAVALWLYARVGADVTVGYITAVHLVLSAGLGLLFTPLFTMALGGLPPRLHSHGSATLSTLQQLAGAVATAGVVVTASMAARSATARGASVLDAATAGVRTALVVTAVVASLGAVGAVVASVRRGAERSEVEVEPVG